MPPEQMPPGKSSLGDPYARRTYGIGVGQASGVGWAAAESAIKTIQDNKDLFEGSEADLMEQAIRRLKKLPRNRQRAIRAVVLDPDKTSVPADFDSRISIGALRSAFALIDAEKTTRDTWITRIFIAIGFVISALLQIYLDKF